MFDRLLLIGPGVQYLPQGQQIPSLNSARIGCERWAGHNSLSWWFELVDIESFCQRGAQEEGPMPCRGRVGTARLRHVQVEGLRGRHLKKQRPFGSRTEGGSLANHVEKWNLRMGVHHLLLLSSCKLPWVQNHLPIPSQGALSYYIINHNGDDSKYIHSIYYGSSSVHPGHINSLIRTLILWGK